jgi:hypothetical protein
MKAKLLKPIALPWMLLLFLFTQASARQILIPQTGYQAAHEKLAAIRPMKLRLTGTLPWHISQGR